MILFTGFHQRQVILLINVRLHVILFLLHYVLSNYEQILFVSLFSFYSNKTDPQTLYKNNIYSIIARMQTECNEGNMKLITIHYIIFSLLCKCDQLFCVSGITYQRGCIMLLQLTISCNKHNYFITCRKKKIDRSLMVKKNLNNSFIHCKKKMSILSF